MPIDMPRVYRGGTRCHGRSRGRAVQELLTFDRPVGSRLGWRDYTILYLLAHYGLRPCEVVALRLDSIDWQAKTLRVQQRKTRSVLLLPLADRTLRVIKRYLNFGRPGSARAELSRARGPSGAIKHTAVCSIYQVHAARSGLALQGTSAYCLRHSFAMRLLERGVGIKAIGDVLGHRGLESTCARICGCSWAYCVTWPCCSASRICVGAVMSSTTVTAEFDRSIADYLERQRALGRAYIAEEDILRSLYQFTCAAGERDVDLASLEHWRASHEGLTGNVRRNRQRIVHNWCLYRQRSEPSCFVPDPEPVPEAASPQGSRHHRPAGGRPHVDRGADGEAESRLGATSGCAAAGHGAVVHGRTASR